MSTFLNLPLEVRDQIYTYLLTVPSVPSHDEALGNHNFRARAAASARLHPAILSVSRQTHAEALPVLYARNTFECHHFFLARYTRLYDPCPTTTATNSCVHDVPQDYFLWRLDAREATCPGCLGRPRSRGSLAYLIRLGNPGVPLIRRWHLRVHLDSRPPWEAADLTRVVAGAELLTVSVWQKSPSWCYAHAEHADILLRVLERVRGVGRVRVVGCADRLGEGYVRWLEGVMSSPVGTDVAPYGDAGEVAGGGVLSAGAPGM